MFMPKYTNTLATGDVISARLEVVTAVLLKMQVVWGLTQCRARRSPSFEKS
jgi:hypothetical protein